jgi:hypothetical protein
MKILLIAFFVIMLFEGTAYSKTPWYRPIEHFIGKNYFIEISAGGSYSNFFYSQRLNNQIDRKFNIKPDLGLTFRVQFKKYLSLASTFSYENRGVTISDQIEYQLSARFFTFYLPVEYNWLMFPRSRSKSGYFISFAPYAGIPFAGSIQYEGMKLPLSKGNFKQYDIGAEIGAGVRICTYSNKNVTNIRFRLSYCQGFINTFSAMEMQGEAIALNLPKYIIDGNRLNQLVKLTVSLEFPFKQKEVVSFVAGGDGKRTYKKFVNIY